jgi:hypothetical protein
LRAREAVKQPTAPRRVGRASEPIVEDLEHETVVEERTSGHQVGHLKAAPCARACLASQQLTDAHHAAAKRVRDHRRERALAGGDSADEQDAKRRQHR